jgi:hypothetical protein
MLIGINQNVQQQNQKFLEFKNRVDILAAKKRLKITDMPEIIGISQSTLSGHRSGKIPISSKTWAKLEAAENEAGITNSPPAKTTLYPEQTSPDIATFVAENPDHPYVKAMQGDYYLAIQRASAALERALSKDNAEAVLELRDTLNVLNQTQRQNLQSERTDKTTYPETTED